MDVKKTISSLVAAAVIGGTGVVQTTKPLEPIDVISVNEIVSQRTETAKVFDVNGDKRRVVISASPVHYKDKSGDWKTIDTSVRKRALLTAIFSKYEYEAAAGAYNAYFDKDSDSDYGFNVGGSQVDFAFLDADKNITVKTETTNSGVKQYYILLNSDAPTELHWTVTTEAVAINAADANCDYLFEKDKKHAFTITAPIAWDANYKEMPVSSSVSGDMLTYSVILPKDVVFPVTVDPSVTVAGDTDATTGYFATSNASYATCRANSSAQNASDNANIYVGQNFDGSTHSIIRSVLRFDTSTIGALSVVDSAKVKLTIQSDSSTTDFDMLLVEASSSLSATEFAPATWSKFTGWASSGVYSVTSNSDKINTSTISAPGDTLTYTLNSNGVSSVVGNGTSQYFLLSDEDINNSAPAHPEYVRYEDDSPYIQIWYTPYVGWSGTINGVTDPAKIMGIDAADIKSVMGVE